MILLNVKGLYSESYNEKKKKNLSKSMVFEKDELNKSHQKNFSLSVCAAYIK